MPSKPVRSAEAKRKTRIYLAIAALTLIILLVTLAAMPRQNNLQCERLATGEVNCEAKETILGVITLKEKMLIGAQAISIDQQCPDIKCTYRLQIYTTQGNVPLTDKYSSNYKQLLRVKDEINKFFADTSSPSVSMKEELNPYLLGAILLVVVLIWVYLGYLIWKAHHPDEV